MAQCVGHIASTVFQKVLKHKILDKCNLNFWRVLNNFFDQLSETNKIREDQTNKISEIKQAKLNKQNQTID